MFYEEKLPLNKQKELEVRITDFSDGLNASKSDSVLPLKTAINTYNFKTDSGNLTTGLGLKKLATPYVVFGTTYTKQYDVPEAVSSIKNVWLYSLYRHHDQSYDPVLLIFGDNGKLYSTNFKTGTGFSEVGSMTLTGDPVGINCTIDDDDCMLFASTSSQDFLYSLEGLSNIVRYDGCPSVLSVAKYAGRLFATSTENNKKLYYSSDLDPRNWTVNDENGGVIDISDERGPLNKLIEANNYLYIIRDFGITRLSGWENRQDFVLRNLFLSTSKIYANTAVDCGDRILMLCKDGLYSFDGNDAKKLDLGFEKFLSGVDNENAIASYLDGKYYLALKLNFGDNQTIGCESGNYKNNVLIEYDLSTGKYQILRGVDVKILLNLQVNNFSRLVCCLNTQGKTNILFELTHDGKILDDSTTKFWQSPTTDLGFPEKEKILTEIFTTSKSDLQVFINTDHGEYSFNVSASIVPKKCKLNVRCRTFSITLKTMSADVDILPPTIKAIIV